MIYPADLFKLIQSTSYEEVGNHVNYVVIKYDSEKKIRLMFQESRGVDDWITNFSFPVKPYKNQENKLLFHGGYVEAWKSANDRIMDDLIGMTNCNPDYAVEISGWSLGGALAVIAAEDFYFRTKKRSALITFGAPKVCFGEKTVDAIIDSCYFVAQYAHVNDLVPLMPPFPFYQEVFNIDIGDGFSLFKLFNVEKYHCSYGDKSLYP